MSFDQRLAASIEDAVSHAALSAGDPRAAMATGAGVRRRRRRLSVGAVGATVAAVALVAAVWQPRASTPAHPAGPSTPSATTSPTIGPTFTTRPGWTRAAPSPLAPRWGALMVWTGTEVLVLGGTDSTPCPSDTADCGERRDDVNDAAAYDPSSNTWRPVAVPPTSVSFGFPAVVADGVVVLGSHDRWWTYEPDADAWRDLPAPPDTAAGPQSALGGSVYTVDRQGRVVELDVASRQWSTLPPDPLRPALWGTVFATEVGVVHTGVSFTEAAPDEPILTQADVWDGSTWTRLPRTGMLGELTHWTGERLLGTEAGSADGGATNGWVRSYPYGGALDPATGVWEPVPGLPGATEGYGAPEPPGTWSVEAAAGPLIATGGRVYDDRTRLWTSLGAPDSALDANLTATWADGRLVFFGGYDSSLGYDYGVIDQALADETWIWTPGTASDSRPDQTPQQVTVPDVVGLKVDEAEQLLLDAGLDVDGQVVECAPTDSCLAGTVTDIAPDVGVLVPLGSTVTVEHF